MQITNVVGSQGGYSLSSPQGVFFKQGWKSSPISCTFPHLHTRVICNTAGGAIHVHTLRTWVSRRIPVQTRLKQVCLSYLLFLMVVARKHSLEEAARFSGLHTSQFSKFLKHHPDVAKNSRTAMSTKAIPGITTSPPSPWRFSFVERQRIACRPVRHGCGHAMWQPAHPPVHTPLSPYISLCAPLRGTKMERVSEVL
jgi:hypothetical protein